MFFLDILTHYRRGALNRAINEKLADLAKACRTSNKTGEITVKIKLKPSKSGGNEFTFAGHVSTKVPETTIPEAIFYIDEKSGEITRDDPAQEKLFDEEAGGATSLDRKRLETMQNAIAAG